MDEGTETLPRSYNTSSWSADLISVSRVPVLSATAQMFHCVYPAASVFIRIDLKTHLFLHVHTEKAFLPSENGAFQKPSSQVDTFENADFAHVKNDVFFLVM